MLATAHVSISGRCVVTPSSALRRSRFRELRLEVREVAVHRKGAARRAQLPAKPQVRDGALVKDDAGKIQYVHIMDFDSREVRDAFSRACIDAVTRAFPDAFEDGEVAA